FQGMGQAGAVKVTLVEDEHLRLVLEATERCGVEDAVPVALESGARIVAGLRIAAPPAGGGLSPIRCQPGRVPCFLLLPGAQPPTLQRIAASHSDPPAWRALSALRRRFTKVLLQAFAPRRRIEGKHGESLRNIRMRHGTAAPY